MDDVVTLLKSWFEKDDIGQQVAKETKREVFCNVDSASRTEWRDAGMVGLRAERRVTMPLCNYCGEEIVEIHGTRYTVYRGYIRKGGDEIELHLERRSGA